MFLLFVHNLNRIVDFWYLFLVEIYRKIKVNFHLLCLDYEQINNQNIDNSECFGVQFVKIYPEMTSQ